MAGGRAGSRPASSSARSSPARVLRLDHTHTPHQRRVARAIQESLARIVEPTERVLALTEAIELGSLLDRSAHGCWWAPARRVALVFTGQRLIEIGLGALGRRARGRVRSFPWERVPALQLGERWLEVRTWSEESFRWYLRDEPEAEIQDLLHSQVDLAVSTYRPSDVRSVPVSHCGACGAVRPSDRDACRHCGMLPRSPRLAGWLAFSLPGAGHLYAGRPLAAAGHLALETGAFAAAAAAAMTSVTYRQGALAMAAGLVVVGLLKLQAAVSARLLAARSAAIPPTRQRRWRALAALTSLVTVVALALPFALIGAADSRISWDLDFLAADGGWAGRYAHPLGGLDAGQPGERSRWLSREGLAVRVDARPLPAFQSVEQAWSRLPSELGGDAEEVSAGTFRAVRSIVPAGDQVQVRIAVIDPVGRDVHVLSARVPTAIAEHDCQQMERLLRRGIWVLASAPHHSR